MWAKLKAYSGHICPTGHMLCMPDVDPSTLESFKNEIQYLFWISCFLFFKTNQMKVFFPFLSVRRGKEEIWLDIDINNRLNSFLSPDSPFFRLFFPMTARVSRLTALMSNKVKIFCHNFKGFPSLRKLEKLKRIFVCNRKKETVA